MVLQRRLRIVVNTAMANLLRMHREELLARFARREVPLAVPEFEFFQVCVGIAGEFASRSSLAFEPGP